MAELTDKVIASTRVGSGGLTQTWLGTEGAPFLRYCDLPVADAQVMADFYAKLSEQEGISGLDSNVFLSGIGFRVYEEWCMEQEKADPEKRPFNWHANLKYTEQGYPGFMNYVANETHLELDMNSGRGGRIFEWGVSKGRFDNFDEGVYRKRREVVVKGLVLRAIDCRKRWGGIHPQEGNDENLRANLEHYVIKALLIENNGRKSTS